MPDAGCRMPDVGCRMSDVGCRMSDVGCRMSDVRCQMSDVRCRMPDAGCQMSDVRCRMSDVGCRMSDVGCQMSDVRCRMSDVGCRMSDVGCRMSGSPPWVETHVYLHAVAPRLQTPDSRLQTDCAPSRGALGDFDGLSRPFPPSICMRAWVDWRRVYFSSVSSDPDCALWTWVGNRARRPLHLAGPGDRRGAAAGAGAVAASRNRSAYDASCRRNSRRGSGYRSARDTCRSDAAGCSAPAWFVAAHGGAIVRAAEHSPAKRSSLGSRATWNRATRGGSGAGGHARD